MTFIFVKKSLSCQIRFALVGLVTLDFKIIYLFFNFVLVFEVLMQPILNAHQSSFA
jgi:hypothetical protein